MDSRSQNSSAGTYTYTHASASGECSLTTGTIRLGNGTTGRIEVCLSANTLVSTCGGGNNKIDQLYIYDDSNNDDVPDNALAVWTPATTIGTCILTAASNGYVWIFFCPQATCDAGDMSASKVSVSWSTYTTPSNDQIGSAIGVDLCGSAFTANNIMATTTGNCAGYVGNSGPPTNQNVTFYNNLDCNNATAGAAAPANANGGDVAYTVENDMYYTFCPATTGTWTITLSKVKCYTTLGGAASSVYGYQYALFQGTPSSLGTVISGGTSGMNQTGSTTIYVSVTSTTSCYYLQIDGYAGTGCVFGFNMAAPSGLCSLLGMNLLTFNAYQSDHTVRIDWATSNEENTAYFVMEKSRDGVGFEDMVLVNATGNSSARVDYHTWDAAPYVGYTYYRLKEVDMSGNAVYSQVISTDQNSESDGKTIYVDYSQPGYIDFSFFSKTDMQTNIEVYDTKGKLIDVHHITVVRGSNAYLFSSAGISGGMYLLKLGYDQDARTQKFFVSN